MNDPQILAIGLSPNLLEKTVVLKGKECQVVPVQWNDFLGLKKSKSQILLAIIANGLEHLDLVNQFISLFPTIPLLFLPKKNEGQKISELLEFKSPNPQLISKIHLIDKVELATIKGGKVNSEFTIKVDFLGKLNIQNGDNLHLPVNGRLTADLLSWMLFHHKTKWHRDKMILKFWEGIDSHAAKNSLRVNIFNLKKLLKEFLNHPYPIMNEGAFYYFNPDLQFETDVDKFKHYYHIGKNEFRKNNNKPASSNFQKALDLYQGDLLENFSECSWCVFDRENLRNQYLEIMYLMAQINFKNENYPEAIYLFKKILEFDKTREASHRGIMECYMKLKQRSLAIRQYMICEKTLWEEYKMKVSAETIVLFEQLKNG